MKKKRGKSVDVKSVMRERQRDIEFSLCVFAFAAILTVGYAVLDGAHWAFLSGGYLLSRALSTLFKLIQSHQVMKMIESGSTEIEIHRDVD